MDWMAERTTCVGSVLRGPDSTLTTKHARKAGGGAAVTAIVGETALGVGHVATAAEEVHGVYSMALK